MDTRDGKGNFYVVLLSEKKKIIEVKEEIM